MMVPTTATRGRVFMAILAVLAVTVAGCVTLRGGQGEGAAPPPPQPGEADSLKRIDELTVILQKAKKDLEAEREDKRRLQEGDGARIRELEVRLRTLETAYANALTEVLRLRNRIGSLIAEPEAAAMFAEARVLVDRMEEEAFNDMARGYLSMAQRYLKDGKKSLDEKNYQKASFFFETITTTHQDFKKTSPRNLTVLSSTAVLRTSPSASAERAGVVEKDAVLEGIERKEGWFRVKGAGGLSGWIKRDSVY